MFKKILVPMDGSKHSDKALRYSIMLAEQFTSKIILVHVYTIPTVGAVGPAMGATSLTSEVVDAVQKSGEQILKSAEDNVKRSRKIKKKLIPVKSYLQQGNTVDQIVHIAKKEKVNLIVMGARGVSKLKEVFLGSVSNGVARNANCPVMIIK